MDYNTLYLLMNGENSLREPYDNMIDKLLTFVDIVDSYILGVYGFLATDDSDNEYFLEFEDIVKAYDNNLNIVSSDNIFTAIDNCYKVVVIRHQLN